MKSLPELDKDLTWWTWYKGIGIDSAGPVKYKELDFIQIPR